MSQPSMQESNNEIDDAIAKSVSREIDNLRKRFTNFLLEQLVIGSKEPITIILGLIYTTLDTYQRDVLNTLLTLRFHDEVGCFTSKYKTAIVSARSRGWDFESQYYAFRVQLDIEYQNCKYELCIRSLQKHASNDLRLAYMHSVYLILIQNMTEEESIGKVLAMDFNVVQGFNSEYRTFVLGKAIVLLIDELNENVQTLQARFSAFSKIRMAIWFSYLYTEDEASRIWNEFLSGLSLPKIANAICASGKIGEICATLISIGEYTLVGVIAVNEKDIVYFIPGRQNRAPIDIIDKITLPFAITAVLNCVRGGKLNTVAMRCILSYFDCPKNLACLDKYIFS
jgi:hypothetical protein